MHLSNKESKRLISAFGQWAIVTGATSGIGLELARQLAGSGFNLLIAARNAMRLEEVKTELTMHEVSVHCVVADLSEPSGIEIIIEASRGLNIGLLVNNAGFGTSGEFHQSSIENEINMLRVNCESVLSLTHYFARVFKNQGRGGIIFLSSVVAFQGVPFAAHYAATKAYIQSFAEAIAVELKPHNVHVLTAIPGPVASGFANRANMKMPNAIQPASLALPILHALGRRKNVAPGMMSKILVNSLRSAPRVLRIAIMRRIMGGFTRHQLKTEDVPKLAKSS